MIKKFANLIVDKVYEDNKYVGFNIIENKDNYTINYIAELLSRYCNGAKHIKYKFVCNKSQTKIKIEKL